MWELSAFSLLGRAFVEDLEVSSASRSELLISHRNCSGFIDVQRFRIHFCMNVFGTSGERTLEKEPLSTRRTKQHACRENDPGRFCHRNNE